MAAGAAGGGYLRASDADREQVIGILKDAFVQGRLDKDEFGLRVGQVFASRTYAELAAVTDDLPAGLTTATPATPARAQGQARIPRPGVVLTMATVLYPGLWAFLLLTGAGQSGSGPGGASALLGLATVVYFLVAVFAGAQLLENRQQERSGGHSPRRPAAGAGGQASRRLPSAGPGRQLPPGHRARWHTAGAARSRLPRPPWPVRGRCATPTRCC